MRVPKHIGIIPDGNRRWAVAQGLDKSEGYQWGLESGTRALRKCKQMGIEEVTFYGFTADNTKRPREQRLAFTDACVDAVEIMEEEGGNILVVGNDKSAMFPAELVKYKKRQEINIAGIKVNLLVNYSWEWDLKGKENKINSWEVSRIDLIIRWGGMRRLSGFLPVQSVYSDFYVLDNYWPDYEDRDIEEAIKWYDKQDITLGG